MALESRKYHHSTQNQKKHRTISLDFFRKKSTFPLCFHFTIINKLLRTLPGGQFKDHMRICLWLLFLPVESQMRL